MTPRGFLKHHGFKNNKRRKTQKTKHHMKIHLERFFFQTTTKQNLQLPQLIQLISTPQKSRKPSASSTP